MDITLTGPANETGFVEIWSPEGAVDSADYNLGSDGEAVVTLNVGGYTAAMRYIFGIRTIKSK